MDTFIFQYGHIGPEIVDQQYYQDTRKVVLRYASDYEVVLDMPGVALVARDTRSKAWFAYVRADLVQP